MKSRSPNGTAGDLRLWPGRGCPGWARPALLCAAVWLLTALPSPAVTHYVWTNSPTPTAPYTDWPTAAHDIQSAIDASAINDTVLVTNGVYDTGGVAMYGTMTNRVVLTNAVTVLSVNGPAATVIKGKGPMGDGAVRCAYVGTNCLLAGFTLTNGATLTSGDSILGRSGGGVWCMTGGTVSNCTVAGNFASQGGGVYGGTLYRCTLSGNSASYEGGGSYGGVLRNCLLSGNSADSFGGGARDSTLYDCKVSGNTAGSEGGGTCGGTLYNCTLSGNSTTNFDNFSGFGGGASGGVLRNCRIFGNSARVGGGTYYHAVLYNCTLTGNSARDQGGGAYISKLNNCIAYYNTAPSGADVSAGWLTNCCTTPDLGVHVGIGNITDEPRLVSACRIAADSPCVGAGNAAVTSGTDCDGEPWRNPPAMGADEPYATSTGAISVAIQMPYTTVAMGFPAPLTALIEGPATRSAWDFGDGSGRTNMAYVSHVWAVTGLYAVVLRAWNADHLDGVGCTVTVSVVEQPVHYVSLSNATPAAPYTSWATAATNIQDAISAGSVPGRWVWVSNGIYEAGGVAMVGAMTNRVVLTNGVRVSSVNGPGATAIKGRGPVGDGAVRCAYLGADCLLAGFTLTQGATRTNGDWVCDMSGGGVWCAERATVSNCTPCGNAAACYAGGVFGGELYNCTLSGNVALYGGGVCGGTLSRCALSSNTATGETSGGGGAWGSVLHDCALIGNVASGPWTCGGGASFSTLFNCTLLGNSGGAMMSALYNCIVYYSIGVNHDVASGSSTLKYCCTTPDPGGIGNITNEPGFVNTNGWRNLRLAPGSPCVDAGTNQDWMTGATDLDGNPRIVNGRVDMGCYEWLDADSDGLPDSWEQAWFGSLARNGTGDYDRDGVSDAVEYQLNWNPVARGVPAWWTARGVLATNAVTNDYAAVAAGQLKWMATAARTEMNSVYGLGSPAGTNINAVVNAFSSSNGNYNAVNLGQVKTVAQPFYDRLIELSRADRYPWTGASSTNNHGAANIGQVKHVFSFPIE